MKDGDGADAWTAGSKARLDMVEDGGSGEVWEAYSLVVWREAASSMADPPRSGKATVETKQQEG